MLNAHDENGRLAELLAPALQQASGLVGQLNKMPRCPGRIKSMQIDSVVSVWVGVAE